MQFVAVKTRWQVMVHRPDREEYLRSASGTRLQRMSLFAPQAPTPPPKNA
jgi:hypothetical protein